VCKGERRRWGRDSCITAGRDSDLVGQRAAVELRRRIQGQKIRATLADANLGVPLSSLRFQEWLIVLALSLFSGSFSLSAPSSLSLHGERFAAGVGGPARRGRGGREREREHACARERDNVPPRVFLGDFVKRRLSFSSPWLCCAFEGSVRFYTKKSGMTETEQVSENEGGERIIAQEMRDYVCPGADVRALSSCPLPLASCREPLFSTRSIFFN
jgi:hypothetical protein